MRLIILFFNDFHFTENAVSNFYSEGNKISQETIFFHLHSYNININTRGCNYRVSTPCIRIVAIPTF